MRSILSGFQKLVQTTPQSESESEKSLQPKSSPLPMNQSESRLDNELQSPQQTEIDDSKMLRNEPELTTNVQSRSPQRTEIENLEKAIIVIREHQIEGHGSAEQVGSPIPPVIVELTDDGDSSVAPQCSQPEKTAACSVTQISDASKSVRAAELGGRSVSSRLRKRKENPAQCSERKTRQKTTKGKEPAKLQTEASQGFDKERFISAEAERRYAFFSNRKLLEELKVKFGENDKVKKLISDVGLLRTVTDIEDSPSEILWEFWSNLPTVKSENGTVEVLVRNWVYEFSPEKINALFGLQPVDERSQQRQMAGVLDEDLALFMSEGKIKVCKEMHLNDVKDPIKKDLLKICCTNWSPTTNDGYVSSGRARIVYMVMNNMKFDFGRLVFDHVIQLARAPAAKFLLPFPSLIYQLLQAQHPVKIDCATSDVKNIKRGKTVEKNSAPETPSAAQDLRRAVKLAIQILQDALDAGGECD